MPTKIQMHITGLSLCYFEDSIWNILFVCDEHHPLNFTHPAGVSELHIAGRDLAINFTQGRVEPNESPYGSNFDILFNMSAPYAHGVDGEGNSNLEFLRKRAAGRDVVWLKAPASTLSIWKPTENPYFVQEQCYPGAAVEVIGRVGREAVVEFAVSSPVMMEITDPNDPTYSDSVGPFGMEPDPFTLVFDNDCHGQCARNDFLDLYDVVRDKATVDGKVLKFAAGQTKRTLYNGTRQMPAFDLNVGETIESMDQGNCDPSGCHPAPGGGGPWG